MLDIPNLKLTNASEKLLSALQGSLNAKKEAFINVNSKLSALNPMAVISRGYGAVFDKENQIVQSVKDIKTGDEISVKISDGEISATVFEIKRSRKNAKKGS